MNQLFEFFNGLFHSDKWPARWYCGEWTDFHGWLYIISNLAIWLSYFAIPFLILYFIVKRGNDLPFIRVFGLFVLFIIFCGSTHLLDAVIFWVPLYRLNGLLLFLTAIVSVATVVSLLKVMPKLLSLKTTKMMEDIIRVRTQDLESTNRNLKKALDDLDNFVYSASHNLKSPINNIEGLIALQQKTPINEELYTSINGKLNEAIAKVKVNISKITDVAQLQNHNYDDFKDIDVEKLIEDILEENEIVINENHIEIERKIKVKNIRYSEFGLKHIFQNLISNSIKFKSQERSPKIRIRVLPTKNNFVKIEVEDNGLGMDLKLFKDKIFKLFKRHHENIEGSGIGLYMTKRLIEDNQGTIEVESEVNQGTTFKIHLKQ